MSSGAEAGVDAIGGDRSSAIDPSAVVFGADGLVPAIAQDATTGEVLMLAWMNAESLSATLREGRMVYWSRSRRELWRKGDTSGHHQMVRESWIDCDADALLFRVDQVGVACHTGEHTCFHRRLDLNETSVIGDTNLAEDTDV